MELPLPREYVPFKSGPFRMAMGLNELNPDEWIEIDSNYPVELGQKNKLLAEKHDDVFRALPGSESSSKEVLDLLTNHLTQRFPKYFRRDGVSFTNLITNQSHGLSDPAMHPLDLAARLVQEDLCLMQTNSGVFRLTAASVCFPSRWKLSEKMGLPLSAIHESVPFFDKIASASDRFMERMTPDKSVWRMNWSLHDSPELFQPIAAKPAFDGPLTAEKAGDFLWIRMERQTLRRLPQSGDILFTIRTYVRPLKEFSKPEVARDLASALQNLPNETAEYKGLNSILKPAIAWLDKSS